MSEELKSAVCKPVDYDTINERAKAKAPNVPRVKLKAYGVRKMWDNEQELGEVRVSVYTKFVVFACTRNGFRFLHVREFYQRRSDGKWLPGSQGIVIPVKEPLFNERSENNVPTFIYPLDELLALLTSGAEFVKSMELSNPDNAVWKFRGARAQLKTATAIKKEIK